MTTPNRFAGGVTKQQDRTLELGLPVSLGPPLPSGLELRQQLLESLLQKWTPKDIGPGAYRELSSLREETNCEIFDSDLFSLGQFFEQKGNLEAALTLYGALGKKDHQSSDRWILPKVRPSLRNRASENIAVITGQGGSIGRRIEFQMSRFVEGATEPTMIAGMAVGATVFTTSRAVILPRLLKSSSRLLSTVPFVTRSAASALALVPEVGAFWGTSKGLQELIHPGSTRWDTDTNLRELAGLGITLGFLKSFGFLFGRMGAWSRNHPVPGTARGGATHRMARGVVPESPAFWQQAGMLTGIMAGHGAEIGIGLRDPQDPATFFVDSLIMLAQFNAGGALSHAAFPKLYAFNSRLQQKMALQEQSQVDRIHRDPVWEHLRDFLDISGGPWGPMGSGMLVPALPKGGTVHKIFAPGPRKALELSLSMSSDHGDATGPGKHSSPGEGTLRLKGDEKFQNLPKYQELVQNFFGHRNREKARLFHALRQADSFFKNQPQAEEAHVSQQRFIERVLIELRRSESVGGPVYDSPFSVISAVGRARRGFGKFLKEHKIDSPHHFKDPLGEIMLRYPVGDFAIRESSVAPRPAANKVAREHLMQALRLVRDLFADGEVNQDKRLWVLAEQLKGRRVHRRKKGRQERLYFDGKIRVSVGKDGDKIIQYEDGRDIRKNANGDYYFRPDSKSQFSKMTLREQIKFIPVAERVEEARELLQKNKVRIVLAVGAGRHGTALMDLLRHSLDENHQIDGWNILPMMWARNVDYVHELHLYGTHQRRLPGMVVNAKGRIPLRTIHPRLNNGLWVLSDRIFTALPSDRIEQFFTSIKIRTLGENSIVMPGIKSVKGEPPRPSQELPKRGQGTGMGGDSIPEWFLSQFAREGRYDLMWHLVLQSGLGFPGEMMGINAPQGPVNLSLNSIDMGAAKEIGKLLSGDSGYPVKGKGRTFYRSTHRTMEVGQELFVAAYWGFIKNFIAPGVGYDFASHMLRRKGQVESKDASVYLASRVERALVDAEQTFHQYELPILRERIAKISELMEEPVHNNLPLVGGSKKKALRRWLSSYQHRDVEHFTRAFREHFPGEEDLLGCTQIRDMPKYLREMRQLTTESRGLNFEEHFEDYPGTVKRLASSSNFSVGLLRPVMDRLYADGKILEIPAGQFLAEGIKGIPNAELRWGRIPSFAQEILYWHQAGPPAPHRQYHPTGLRQHAVDVTLDNLRSIQAQALEMQRSSDHPYSREDLLVLIERGFQAIQFLNREMEIIPPVSGTSTLARNVEGIRTRLVRIQNQLETLPPHLSPQWTETVGNPFLKKVGRIIRVLDFMMNSTNSDAQKIGSKQQVFLGSLQEMENIIFEKVIEKQ